MLKNLFLKTLRDQRRSTLIWGIVLFALALYTVLLYPMIQNMPGLDEMMAQLPEGMAEALAGGPLSDLTSPTGYLNSQFYFMMVPLLFIIVTIGYGSGAIAGEEDKGTLEFLLANPVPRRRIVLHKSAVMVICLGVMALALWVAIVIGAVIVDMDVSAWRVLEATFSSMVLALVFGFVALFLGCVKGSRGLSIGVAGGLAFVTYLLNSLGGIVEALRGYRFLSPFFHNLDPNPLKNGLDWHVLVLLGLAVVFFLASIPAFERRDVGV